MDIKTIGSKPEGFRGRLAGMLMNIMHANHYKRIVQRHMPEYTAAPGVLSVLDVGCGGGNTIRILSSMMENAKICGIDHSPDMVDLSRRLNRNGIDKGRIEIVLGEVNHLPYPDASFDLVTAFDTISFWSDIDDSVREIRRVLKPNGRFIVVNGYPREGTRWHDFVRFKNDGEYRAFLSGHGFRGIGAAVEKSTIIVKAVK